MARISGLCVRGNPHAGCVTWPTRAAGPAGITDAAALSISVAVIAGAGVLTATALRPSDAGREVEATARPFWVLGALRPVSEAALWILVGA